jgi:hypothetical protein
MAAFIAALPAQVTMQVHDYGPDAYWLITVSGDGALNGVYDGWSMDIDHSIGKDTNYNADVYSSTESVPAGLIEKPYNLDLVNWILNQEYVGKSSAYGMYTYGDVQRSIWELIEDNPSATTEGLGPWNQNRVNLIKASAIANGEGFIPTCGDYIAVILQPVGGAQQSIAIAQVTYASLGINCADSNAVTAVLNDIEFTASADIAWTKNDINPTATLDDDQKLDWPTTVSADTMFTYSDPQGYTCSNDPAAYTDGYYQYSESNTAVLTYDTGSDTATSSTLVKCYGGSIVTDSSYCLFDRDDASGRQFKLIFTPDVPDNPMLYRLTASNPGQFYYSVLYYVGAAIEPFTITYPAQFATQGANPIHVYSSLGTGAESCRIPGVDVTSSFSIVSNPSTNSITVTPLNGYTGGVYITVHLDYALKKTGGYEKQVLTDRSNAINTINPTLSIPDLTSYPFKVTTPFLHTYTVQNRNVFKHDPGIGGLVLNSLGSPIGGVKVEISIGNKLVGTVFTDEDGWYMWNYKYTGKPTTVTVKLPGSPAMAFCARLEAVAVSPFLSAAMASS